MLPRELLKLLRKRHPTVYPPRTYFRDLSRHDHVGSCELSSGKRGKHFNITVHSRMDPSAQVQVLIHEWAHAVAWLEGHEGVADHGPEWALALSRIYRDLIGE